MDPLGITLIIFMGILYLVTSVYVDDYGNGTRI